MCFKVFPCFFFGKVVDAKRGIALWFVSGLAAKVKAKTKRKKREVSNQSAAQGCANRVPQSNKNMN